MACLAEALEMQAAAGGPPSRLRRYGEKAFAWMQERRLVEAVGVEFEVAAFGNFLTTHDF